MSGFPPHTEVEMLKSLADQAACHVMGVASAVDEHPITVDQTCTQLHNDECIRPLGRGTYEITDQGEQRLESQRQ
jgi:predicted transcriptional regulator